METCSLCGVKVPTANVTLHQLRCSQGRAPAPSRASRSVPRPTAGGTRSLAAGAPRARCSSRPVTTRQSVDADPEAGFMFTEKTTRKVKKTFAFAAPSRRSSRERGGEDAAPTLATLQHLPAMEQSEEEKSQTKSLRRLRHYDKQVIQQLRGLKEPPPRNASLSDGAGPWRCSFCTLVNEAGCSRCAACDSTCTSLVLDSIGMLDSEAKQCAPCSPKSPWSACAICFEGYDGEDSKIFLPCCHSFHERCASAWISRKKECPTCRHPTHSSKTEWDPTHVVEADWDEEETW